MEPRRTKALVLGRIPFGNTSQILDLFTRDRGRVSVLARGSRRIEKRTQHLVDLLYYGEALILEKRTRSVQLLADFQLHDHFLGLRRELERYWAALHALELLKRLTRAEAEDRSLFDLAVQALRRLAAVPRERLPLELLALDLKALARAGFGPRLDRCAACGCRPRPGRAVAYDPARGGVLCSPCAAAAPGARRLAAPLHELLQFLATAPAARRDSLAPPRRALAALRTLVDATLRATLEAPMPVLQYLRFPRPKRRRVLADASQRAGEAR